MATPAKLRVQPGVPAGGQFREQGRPECDTVLLEAVPLSADDLGVEAHPELDDTPGFEVSAGFVGEPEIWDESTAHLFLERSAKFWSHRFGVDAEELAQDTAVAYLTARKNSLRAGLNGESSLALLNPAAYIHATTRNIAAALASRHTRSENRKASRLYRERLGVDTQELGRSLTSVEEDEIAASISGAMKPGRRPTMGYHRVAEAKTVDLDPLDEVLPGPCQPNPAVADEFPAGSAGAAAIDAIEAGGRVNFAVAKNEAWDAVAQRIGAPLTSRLSLSEQVAAKARTAVRAGGGASVIATAWKRGSATAEQTAALFAPFGRLDDAGRTRVVNAMTTRSSYTEQLWDAAITTATRRRSS